MKRNRDADDHGAREDEAGPTRFRGPEAKYVDAPVEFGEFGFRNILTKRGNHLTIGLLVTLFGVAALNHRVLLLV
jgi:hypothetical protein